MMSKTRNTDLLNVETKIGRPGLKRNHCNTAECASISSSKIYRKKFPISTMLLIYSQPLLGVQLVEAQRSKRRSERRRERLCSPQFFVRHFSSYWHQLFVLYDILQRFSSYLAERHIEITLRSSYSLFYILHQVLQMIF